MPSHSKLGAVEIVLYIPRFKVDVTEKILQIINIWNIDIMYVNQKIHYPNYNHIMHFVQLNIKINIDKLKNIIYLIRKISKEVVIIKYE